MVLLLGKHEFATINLKARAKSKSEASSLFFSLTKSNMHIIITIQGWFDVSTEISSYQKILKFGTPLITSYKTFQKIFFSPLSKTTCSTYTLIGSNIPVCDQLNSWYHSIIDLTNYYNFLPKLFSTKIPTSLLFLTSSKSNNLYMSISRALVPIYFVSWTQTTTVP